MVNTMRAAQLVAYNQPLEIREVTIPEPKGEEVLIKVGGAGMCHSDLHIMSGELPLLPYTPFTMGHENAGWVSETGENVNGFQVGDAVAVFGGWSVTPDRFSRLGIEQLNDVTKWGGIGQPGGYAEYLLVPTYRYLLPIGDMSPVEAAPLTDAGLTPYRAINKLLPNLYGGSTVVVVGIGGLGQFGVQYASVLSPANSVIAVDVNNEKLALAKKLGADLVINSKEEDAIERIKSYTNGEGAQGIIDFVGADSTLSLVEKIAGRQAKVVIVGLAGGTLHWKTGSPNEAEFTTSSWGTQAELSEVLALAKQGVGKAQIQRVKFEEMNDVFTELAAGRISGRAVLVPNEHF